MLSSQRQHLDFRRSNLFFATADLLDELQKTAKKESSGLWI